MKHQKTAKTTSSLVLALLFMKCDKQGYAIQLGNINSKYSRFQHLASGMNKKSSPEEDSFVQLGSEQPYGVANEERDNESGYPATPVLDKKYPGNDHKTITEVVQKFIDPKTGYMKTENEVLLEEKAEKAKKVQESIDAAPGLGFKLNMDQLIPDLTGDKYTTTHTCFGSPCPKVEKEESLVQIDHSSIDDEGFFRDDPDRWVKFAKTYGRDPKPFYHDVHYMARPNFNRTIWHTEEEPYASLVQKSSTGQEQEQEPNKKKDYVVSDDTGTRWVKWASTYGESPTYPEYHDVHAMARPNYNSTVYHTANFAQKPVESQNQAEKKDYVVSDDTGTRWAKWASTYGAPPTFPEYHDVHAMARPNYNSTVYHTANFAQQKSKDLDDTGDRWAYWWNTYGQDPDPSYHDVHFMTRPDFNKTTIQWPYRPSSLAQKKEQNKDFYDYADEDKWVRFPHGKDPNPGYHDVHFMTNPDFNKTTLQWPRHSFAQQKEQNKDFYDYADEDKWVRFPQGQDPNPGYHDVHFMTNPDFNKTTLQWPRNSFAQQDKQQQKKEKDILGDDTGDRWTKYPYGREPFPPPHDPQWYTKDGFWNSVYQPADAGKESLAQRGGSKKNENDDVLNDWTGDRWVRYPHGKEPFPPPHDPEWYKKDTFWESVYQPIQKKKSFAQTESEKDEFDDTGERWVRYPQGIEPFPPPHDPEWYKKDTFWQGVYQPIPKKQSFAQTESNKDEFDDTGERWVRYPQGIEPFPPPHDPEWYKKDTFWQGVYQPIPKKSSLAQLQTKDSDRDDDILGDWTGDKWVKYAKKFGREPFLPPHDKNWYKKDTFWESVYQPVAPASLVQLEEEYNGKYTPSEPFDQQLKDVDKIMDYYKEKDARTELEKKEFQLPGDPTGGISTIYAASIKHSKDEDNKYLKNLLEGYSTGGKGPDGMPNGDRILDKWQMQLASEEVINTWTTVTDAAMKLFEKDNFNKVWDNYDTNGRGHIDLDDGVPMMRQFMEAESPAQKTEDETNPYMEKDADEEKEKPKKIEKVSSEKLKKKKEAMAAKKEEKDMNENAEDEGKLSEVDKEDTMKKTEEEGKVQGEVDLEKNKMDKANREKTLKESKEKGESSPEPAPAAKKTKEHKKKTKKTTKKK